MLKLEKWTAQKENKLMQTETQFIYHLQLKTTLKKVQELKNTMSTINKDRQQPPSKKHKTQ